MEKITLELCFSNSIGSRFYPATVKEIWTVDTREEADKQINEPRPNGYFVRESKETN